MNKRVSTLLSALLLATTLGWQQPLMNVEAATHNNASQTTKKAAKKHAKAKKTAKKSTKGKTVKQPANASKHIVLSKASGAMNVRDLGGYVNKNGQKIKAHRLIRSNKLSGLTKADVNKLTKTYHIKTDVDLRTIIEQKMGPDVKMKGVKLVKANVFKGFGAYPDFTKKNAGVKMMKKSYHNAVTTAQGRKAYKQLFHQLLTNPKNKAVLWHCSAGKDRAGMGTVLVLSALNFDKKTIQQDFMKSNKYLKADIQAKHAKAVAVAKDKHYTATQTKNFLANTDAQNTVRMAYLNTFYKTINTKYGSMTNFLHKGLGLSNHQLHQLQTNYLTNTKTK